ncbi:MAG TPA: YdiU family protein [Saprospiraceae bacterium]|nr:YdiU family protein [Saprospiraceae bacterium]
MNLNIKDKFNQALPADPNRSNTRRQVHKSCFSYVTPRVPSAPKLLHVSPEMASALGLSQEDLSSDTFLKVFSGASVLKNTAPYAMCYGGHQFGHWAGQLGDGRAINLAEVEHEGQSWTLQLKGAGETPYSRRADGLAVLRSSIREHLCSEAMYHLGVPTTRSLSLMVSGDQVLRDILYDGNPAYEKGAIVCRVAPSFIRFGNFQIFAARGEQDTLKELTDFTIKHFFPTIQLGSKDAYVAFFQEVANRTLEMIVHWQRVGFVHGVMNTDNMSILGLTIDYGPYGWLEDYDPNWTPNTTDAQGRRYRFGHQPRIALWNLIQLANALVPLIEKTEPLQEIIDGYSSKFEQAYLAMMHQKLGLEKTSISSTDLITQLETILPLSETDMTIFFRKLADFSKETPLDEPGHFLAFIQEAFYRPEEIKADLLKRWKGWFANYQEVLRDEALSDVQRKANMNQVNPKYVLRNYMAQLAIDAADKGDYSLIQELYELLQQPYAEQPEKQKWFAKRPEWARHKVGCSMLSCSS